MVPVTKKIRDKYNQLFAESPIKANIFLMFSRLADSTGKIAIRHKKGVSNDKDVLQALEKHFEDVLAYNLPKQKTILEKRWK